MTSGSPVEVREPISPELVLVAPPDEARVARDRLPDPALAARRRLQEYLTFPSGVVTIPTGAVAIPAPRKRSRGRSSARWLGAAAALLLTLGALAAGVWYALIKTDRSAAAQWRTLSGDGNNVDHPGWGAEDKPYRRVAGVSYTDGIKKMVPLPSARYISNRIFNDAGQNLFSENGVTQWGWAWGQFIDHDVRPARRDARREGADPVRRERSVRAVRQRRRRDRVLAHAGRARHRDVDSTPGSRSTRSRATSTRPRSTAVDKRLDWLGAGPSTATCEQRRYADARRDGYLPRVDARGNAGAAPPMDLMGPLRAPEPGASSPATCARTRTSR